MRLSEKLEEVLKLSKSRMSLAYLATIDDLLRDHGDELRQALRDSERLAAAPAGSLRAPHLRPDGRGSIEVEFGKWPMVFFTGQRVRLVIEDAAMGRREGEA